MPHLDPEQEASGVLRTQWAWDGDLPVIPVDPVAIARRLGLEVYTAELAEGVSGMLTSEPGEGRATIYLNEADALPRQRFTCGHEIGHWIRHALKGETETLEFVDLRAHLASRGVDREEIWANQFSAALLMPTAVVRSLLPDYGESGLAYRLNVSLSAIGYRVGNLRAAGLL